MSEKKNLENIDIDSVLDDYFAYLSLEKNYSSNTIESYSLDLGQWAGYLEENKIHFSKITAKNLTSFLAERIKKGNLEKISLARKTASIKAFYKFLEKKAILPVNLLKEAKAPKYRRKLPRPLRPIDLEIFLEDETVQNKSLQIRDKALWELMYSSGMRISEILTLDVSNVFDAEERIYEEIKIMGKGSKERVVFIGKLAAGSLAEYYKIRKTLVKDDKENALFLNQKGSRLSRRGAVYIMSMRKKHLKIDAEFTPHSMRHSFATDMINGGADIRMVQDMLGHSSISTTQNYTAVAKESLQAAFRNCHPHAKKEG
ncbi:MAG: tyrosine-type recombinase/integrase [Spirochaetia bacterium]|nr:tyrosine-type recombinase/integrase [Spirochaetia bacterium]